MECGVRSSLIPHDSALIQHIQFGRVFGIRCVAILALLCLLNVLQNLLGKENS